MNNIKPILGAFILFFSPVSLGAVISIIDSSSFDSILTTQAISRQSGQDDEIFESVSSPFSASHNASIGNAFAETSYSFGNSGLSFLFDHSHTFRGAEASSFGTVFFMVDEIVNYELSGMYSFIGADSHETYFQTTLAEMAVGFIFENRQGNASPITNLVIGEAQGNRVAELSGDQSGLLYADTLYRFTYRARISNLAPGASSGTADGNLSLNISPVPAPAAVWLFGIGMIGLGFARRKQQPGIPSSN